MNINVKNIAKWSFSLVALAYMVMPEVAVAIDGLFGFGGEGVVMGMALVQGTNSNDATEAADSGTGAGTGNLLYKRDVSQIVTEIKPDDFPLDTILRNIRGAESAYNRKVEYEEVTFRSASATATSSDSVSGLTQDVTFANDKTFWAVDDIAFVPAVTGNGAAGGSRCIVTAVNTTTGEVSFQAINTTGNTMTSLGSTPVCFRLGNAKTELDAQTTSVYSLPAQDFNYAQTFMAQIERSVIESKYNSISGYSFQDKVRQVIYDMRSSMERSLIAGVKSKTTVGSDIHYTADGLLNKISKSFSFGASGAAGGYTSSNVTVSNVIDMLENAFAGNAGSDSRLLLGGKEFISGLSKVDKYDRNLQSEGNTILHGVQVRRLVSDFGVLDVKHSKAMDELGLAKKALILDLDHIYKHELEPMSVEELDLNKAGSRRTQDAMRMIETSCSSIRYSGANGVHVVVSPTS
tara:strand:- start:364 stop:1749 length:1386 start_codon:yes stop_codon:yes gene_type:complete